MLYELCFSPTGGTKKAADLLCGGFEAGARFIDLSDSTVNFEAPSFRPEDVCVVAVPAFGGRVPAVAAKRLERMSGGHAAAVLLCSFGNRAYDDALLELQELLTKREFFCAAAVAAVTQHSIMPQFGQGRPNAQDESELAAYAEKIKAKLEKRTESEPALQVPGNRPYREYGGVPFTPKAEKSCSQCGLCAAKCPVQAIDPGRPSETDADACISCMRCIFICPQKARSLNPALLFASTQKLKKACSSPKSNELFL